MTYIIPAMMVLLPVALVVAQMGAMLRALRE